MIIVGDIHAKNKEPYRTAINEFFKWLIQEYPRKSQEEIVLLGDLFDSSSPHNTIKDEIIDHLLKFHFVHIITGNHDFSKRQGNVLKPFRHLANVRVYEDITKVQLGGLSCIMLPYQFGDIKTRYESLKEKCDVVFSHVSPLGKSFGTDEIDVAKGVRADHYIYGHIHHYEEWDCGSSKHIILGVPLPTRNLEVPGQILHVNYSGAKKFIKVPEFLKISTIKYGEIPENKNWLYNVIDAPSAESVFEKYAEFHIRETGIRLLRSENEIDTEVMKFSMDNTRENWLQYCKEQKVPREITELGLKYL